MTTPTPPAGDTPAPRPLLNDSGWDREACGLLAWTAHCHAARQFPGVLAWSPEAWVGAPDVWRERWRVQGVTVAEAVRHAIIVRIAHELNGGDR